MDILYCLLSVTNRLFWSETVLIFFSSLFFFCVQRMIDEKEFGYDSNFNSRHFVLQVFIVFFFLLSFWNSHNYWLTWGKKKKKERRKKKEEKSLCISDSLVCSGLKEFRLCTCYFYLFGQWCAQNAFHALGNYWFVIEADKI